MWAHRSSNNVAWARCTGSFERFGVKHLTEIVELYYLLLNFFIPLQQIVSKCNNIKKYGHN
jgi:hypothetical protein